MTLTATDHFLYTLTCCEQWFRMKIISAHNGLLQTLAGKELRAGSGRSFQTGIDLLDGLAPSAQWACGAIHELLTEPSHGMPRFVATMIARSVAQTFLSVTGQGNPRPRSNTDKNVCPTKKATQTSTGVVIWSDPHRELYPPALATLGVDLNNLILLRPKSEADELWAIAECLRCSAVAVTVAAPQKLSQIEARRLQLAAERGGGVGLLLRHTGRTSTHYAAATRWLISPARGERTIQRWKIQLLHGHGGRVGENVFLEYSRENHSVRAIEKLPHRQTATKTAKERASA
jgi:hypothetical protein